MNRSCWLDLLQKEGMTFNEAVHYFHCYIARHVGVSKRQEAFQAAVNHWWEGRV